MKSFGKVLHSQRTWLVFAVLVLLMGAGFLTTQRVSANHPVLVEGNCDSPIPGATLVSPGTCGDFDGDGRIGTAEDTDGADRIFGTLRAALGPGTGAAAGTGANHNGLITIVTSGRFAENLFIGNTGIVVGEGVASPGNVTIEAAPGVEANVNAVLQGDPAGGNTTRQGQAGISIVYTGTNRRVVLRNLTISNWATGVHVALNSRVTIDNCRFENNLDFGIRAIDASSLGVFASRVSATGFRLGAGVQNVTATGHAIAFEGTAAGDVSHTHVTGNFGAPIANSGAGAVTYYEVFLGLNALAFTNTGAGTIAHNPTP